VAQLAQNRPHEALTTFRYALRLDPHNPVLHNNIRLLQKKI
jgi:Flp pilus assembly protein TadD